MTVDAYAKINFTLEVFGRRPDGYHALRSLVLPISLADAIEIEKSADYSSDSGYGDDLCLKAARVLGAGGVDIRLTKRIPVGGGLGGGSADAAAVLRTVNELYGLGRSRAELAEIGAQVGSDVPALVLGGPVVMEGRGEKVEPMALAALDLVLVDPGVEVSTAAVYEAFEEMGAPCSPDRDATATAVDTLRGGDFARIAASPMNALQMAAVKLHPEIADAIVSLRTAGAQGVTMSGSGSCIFGLAPDAASAGHIAQMLNRRGCHAWAVRTLTSENMV